MKYETKLIKENNVSIARKLGYVFIGDANESEISFVRALDRSGYPRFHLYVQIHGDMMTFNLHLDQKRPVYQGATAHSGEYDGKLVEDEMERIKKIII